MDRIQHRYIVRNILRGLLLLLFFAVLYGVFQRYVHPGFLTWLEPVFSRHVLILLVFLISELIIGLIPPELFIMWAVQFGDPGLFLVLVSTLAIISFSAGLAGYAIGRHLNRIRIVRYFRIRFLRNLGRQLHRFGPVLLLLATLTPLPFSGVCMLLGSVYYPFPRFFMIAMTRFLRFALYAYVFWEVARNVQ